ncbi:unnamed protein product, partial [Laminaria digitata]
LLQRLQHRQKEGGARRGGKLRASSHAVTGQVQRHKTTRRVFQMDTGVARTIACSSGVQQGDPMGPAMFCLALRPGLKRFRQELE